MQGIEATFDDLSFEDGDTPQRVLPKIVPGAAALALAGAVGVWALHWVSPTIPEALFSRWAPASTVAPVVSKAFADIAIDDNLLAQLKAAAPAAPSQQVASLEAAPSVSSAPFPLPRLEPFPPAPAIPPAASVPLPPGRDVPEIGETESFPLPPVRPSGFGAPTQSTTPERHASRPNVAVAPPAAPTDNRNVFEKLFGWAHSSSPVVASTTQARTAAQPVAAQQRERRVDPSALAEVRCSASRLPLEIPPQLPAMTDIPRSMTSRRASSICPTERGSKPILVSGQRSTIRATWPSAQWARRRRMSTS